ncbi:MAG: hypothetical protein GTO22_27150 [Gemmatimonadales bacterium]|nr:hypothetical protein [Gemmatimonadales bacterium]
MTGTTAALDASSTVDETHADITAPVGLFTNPGDGPLDLATTPIPTGASAIVPGSLSIAVTIGASGETITDDGVGGLSGTGGSLGAGTVDYDTGAMTGITSTLDGASTATASFTLESGLSGVSSVEISSSGTGGRVSFASRPTGSGAPPAVMEWSFAVRFPADFGLNNNSVTGAQSLLLEARLADALTLGGNIVLAWAALSDDAVAPTAWDTPTFTQGSPTTAPTAALALPMDGTWARVTIALVNATTLSVDVDGTTETFTFPRALLVPTEAALRHTWGDALDRAFTVDDWSFSFELPRP